MAEAAVHRNSSIQEIFEVIIHGTFYNNPTCLFFFHPEEEISNMRSELDKYGIQMPAFSKIGGILANELSVDEAACESSDIQLLLVFD